MCDERKWRLAVAHFEAIRSNVPGYVGESFVDDYHAALDEMAAASGEDFDSFRVPTAELKPRVVSVQLGSYRGGRGRTNYSKNNYCDSNLFQRKIDALTAYLPIVEETMCQPQVQDDSRDYWRMSTAQLERLAHEFHIGGYADQHGHVDHDIIIKKLRERDKAMQPQQPISSHFTNTGTIIGSNIQQGSHGSTATATYLQEQRELLTQIRSAMPDLKLTNEQTQTINTDLATIELQLNSSSPKNSIMSECWISVRSILENAAGNAAAAALLYELAQHIHW